MNGVLFLRPELIGFFPAALLVLGILRFSRRRNFLASTTLSLLIPKAYRASLFRRLPAALVVLALAFVVLALMDPVLTYSEKQVQSRGLDIVLVLDLSSSMQELMDRQRPPRSMAHLTFSNRDTRTRQMTTVPPGKTRLATTKEALRDFISHRNDDRIGLVVFSDNAYVVSPLTFDHDYLLDYVQMVDEKILAGEGMTAIGEGIGLANYLILRQAKTGGRRDKVIVVFTDGENNHGRKPSEVIGESDAAGIKVHVIGVALEEEIKNKPEVQRLIETVKRYGGRYYDAATTRELQAAYLDINAYEKGLLTNTVYLRNTPVFEWFALPAVLVLLAGFGVRTIPYFVDLT